MLAKCFINRALFPAFTLLIYTELDHIFLFFFLVSGVFDPGQPWMDVGFLLFHSHGKRVFFFVSHFSYLI